MRHGALVTKPRGPSDPLRKERILDSALTVIATVGVAGTTHRLIAEEADLPLGSLTYHFDTLADIVNGAFERLFESMSSRFAIAVASARTEEEACEAIADLICGNGYATEPELAATVEMYSRARHDPATAEIVRIWLARSRGSLAMHFSPDASHAIDALIEGWPLHRQFDQASPNRQVVTSVIAAIAARFPLRELRAAAANAQTTP